MGIQSTTAMTHGEARMWARRLRKMGFRPVTMHRADTDDFGQPVGGYFLRCSWRYDNASLPEDVYQYLTVNDNGYVDHDYTVGNRSDAQHLLAKYKAVRLGMGSRPLSIPQPREAICPAVGATRIVYAYDEWPPEVLSLTYALYLQTLGELDEEHAPFVMQPRFNHPITIAPSNEPSG